MPSYKYPQDISERVHLDISAHEWDLPSLTERNATGTISVDQNPTTDQQVLEAQEAVNNQAADVTQTELVAEQRNRLWDCQLYIPSKFGDSSSSKWEDETVALIGSVKDIGAGLTAIYSGLTGNGFGSDGKKIADAAIAMAQTAVQHYGAKMLGSVGTLANNQLTATTGYRIAPGQSKIFKGSSGVSISLAYSFHPRNSDEAEQMMLIIDAFRASRAPDLATFSVFGDSTGDANTGNAVDTAISNIASVYKSPPTFNIRVMKGNNDPQPIRSGAFYEYKNMVMTSFTSSYSNVGDVYQHFSDGAPVDAECSMTFESIFPLFNVTSANQTG